MIKLNDILNESTKPEIGKITTAKDEPPFMTEEQWNKKWQVKEGKGKINERPHWMGALMIGYLIYQVIHAWAQHNPKKIQKLKNFVSRLDPTKPFRKP